MAVLVGSFDGAIGVGHGVMAACRGRVEDVEMLLRCWLEVDRSSAIGCWKL